MYLEKLEKLDNIKIIIYYLSYIMAIVEVEDNFNIYEKIFKLIKKNNWDEILKLLQKLDVEIDINMKDQTGNYIISYAVLHNRLDVIKILYTMNVQLDVLDADNRSILYIPIKYGYDEILEYLLKINSEMIGVSIIDIKDRNFKTPIQYAINSKNIYAIKKLLYANCNLNTVDNKGYNALHYTILSRDLDIVKLILPGISNINTRTTTGETSLHLAVNLQLIDIAEYLIKNGINVNLQDYSHEFTALHYAVSINNKYLIQLLLDVSGNPNIQDVFGNTPLHYVMIEESYNLIDLFINTKNITTNLNLYNIDGKLPLHILLDAYSKNISDTIMKYLILNSNLAIIDNDGNSCLFLLTGLGIWRELKNELTQKRLDIYSKNKKGISILDLVDKKYYNEFIDMVIDAYMHRLRNKQKEWGKEWENICSKEFITIKPDELKKVFSGKIDSEEKLQKICRNKIREYLFVTLENIKENKIKCAESSYPLSKNKICITLEEGETLDVCTFTGTTLDVLLGLIFLLKKHKSACSTLSTEFYSNENLQNFYKSIGIMMGSRGDFLNFEIVWVHQKLYLVDDFYDRIKDCISGGAEFIIIPLGIEMKAGSHANYIIYDVKAKSVERFEPHGSSTPPGLNYEPSILDELIESRFKVIDENIKYFSPKDYEPKVGFQLLDIFETNRKKIGDPGGFCALWAIWYVDMRLTYKNIGCNELTKILIKSIKTQNISVKNMIRNYATNIISMRDDLFRKVGLDINLWLNDMFTDTQIEKFIELIQNELSQIS